MSEETLHLKVRGDDRTYCLLPVGETDNTDLDYVEDVNCQTCKDGFADDIFHVRSMPRSDFRSVVDALTGAGFAVTGMGLALGGCFSSM